MEGEGPVGPVAGVVLCAGRSRRMGREKALLDAGGIPFVARVVRNLRQGGADPVLAVTRSDAPEVAEAARQAGAVVVVNPDPDHPVRGGPLSSLRAALAQLPADAAGLLLCPVDHPRVEPATVAALVAAFRTRGAPVTAPTFQGRRGHPVILAAPLFAELRSGSLPQGARTVVHRHAAERHEVPVQDPGVLDDLDTPEAYARAYPQAERA